MVADAHLVQGNKFKANSDLMTAVSHYRHAKALLVKANIPMQKKKTLLEQVDVLIEEIQPKKPRSHGSLAESLDRLL